MIEKFTAYEKDTGRLLFSGTSHTPKMFENATVSVVVGESADCTTHYCHGGNLIPMPDRPSDNHVFDYHARTWVTDTKLFDSAARMRRAALFSESDWTQLPDVPSATKAAWAIYRQALRDITLQAGYPQSIVWPAPPA